MKNSVRKQLLIAVTAVCLIVGSCVFGVLALTSGISKTAFTLRFNATEISADITVKATNAGEDIAGINVDGVLKNTISVYEDVNEFVKPMVIPHQEFNGAGEENAIVVSFYVQSKGSRAFNATLSPLAGQTNVAIKYTYCSPIEGGNVDEEAQISYTAGTAIPIGENETALFKVTFSLISLNIDANVGSDIYLSLVKIV